MTPSKLRLLVEHSPLRNPVLALLRWKGKMSACIFCQITAGKSKTPILYSDAQVTAFHDAHPIAPTHILIVPNKHIHSVNELLPEDESLIGHMFVVARQLAAQEGIQEDGYRLIINTGAHGGQTIFHLHLHLVGGGYMRYPIG